MSGGNNNEREFANYVCKMYQYNYLFEFLKKKIGHDCARQIVMMHFRRDPNYGDIENISDYAMRRAMRTTRLRMPPTAAFRRIELGGYRNRNLYFIDSYTKINQIFELKKHKEKYNKDKNLISIYK